MPTGMKKKWTKSKNKGIFIYLFERALHHMATRPSELIMTGTVINIIINNNKINNKNDFNCTNNVNIELENTIKLSLQLDYIQ